LLSSNEMRLLIGGAGMQRFTQTHMYGHLTARTSVSVRMKNDALKSDGYAVFSMHCNCHR